MARYAVISKGLPVDKLAQICAEFGATNIRKVSALNQVFCELTEASAERLKSVSGIVIKPISNVKGMPWRKSSGTCRH